MLSFDFTDFNVKIVKGSLSRGKIIINKAVSVNLPDGVIINGVIQEINKVVIIINDALKRNNIHDRDAVISISSSQIVFKDLVIPRASDIAFFQMVQHKMKTELGISDDYNISYTILGEKEDNTIVNKVIAAACPKSVLTGYKRLFNNLGLPVKKISLSCNSVAKVVNYENKHKDNMPLLTVEVNKNYLNFCLFEDNKLSFSRMVTLDIIEDDESQHILRAINENVFRMEQFNKSRGGSGISDVLFYGDLGEFDEISKYFAQQDIFVHVLKSPSNIVLDKSCEFSQYINAIGSFYKTNRVLEKTNLLEIESSSGRDELNYGFLKSVVLTFLICISIVCVAYIGLTAVNNNMLNYINQKNAYINSTEVSDKLNSIVKYNDYYNRLSEYFNQVDYATDSLFSKKTMKSDVISTIQSVLNEKGEIQSLQFSSSELSMVIKCMDKALPAEIVEQLINTQEFEQVTYNGFVSSENDSTVFSVKITLKAGGR